MDKVVFSALQFNSILDLIIPVGEAGRQYKHHPAKWKPGQETDLRREYKRLEALIIILKENKKLTDQLSSALSELPYLPNTLKALQERPLLLHECFEIKKLVHYALQLKQLTVKHGLQKHYSFPELEKIYALLDPEQAKSPTFTLSPAFDTKLAKLLGELSNLQSAQRKEEHKLLQSAQKALSLNNPTIELVISRLEKEKVKKLAKTEYYLLADENFANLTFRLKDNKQLAKTRKQISALSAQITKTEEAVLKSLSKKLKAYHPVLIQTAELVQKLDWDYAKAVFAMKYNCCIPVITNKLQISVNQAVNLPVKLYQTEQNRSFQPIDLEFTGSLNIITGPNMGGKTTALKTIGQLCLLAHYAIPVPAKVAELCLFDNIWYNQQLESGENLSSFGKEIVSLSGVLRKKGKTIFLFDELAKGTNPVEGEAILTAVLDYVKSLSCLCVAATHYDIAKNVKSAVQYAIKGIDIKALKKFSNIDKQSLEKQLDLINQLMDYSLIKLTGKAAPPQNAIPIAKALSLPNDIIKLAENLISKQ